MNSKTSAEHSGRKRKTKSHASVNGKFPIHVSIEGWAAKTTRAFTTDRDIRDLLVIEHPWQPGRANGFGAWEVTVAPPPGWQPGGRLFVSFYQSDNYSGAWMPWAWMGTQAFIGHRFKQLLVNGEVVWEQDVADEEMAGRIERVFELEAGESGFNEPYRVVDISSHAAPSMVLTFRVIDKVASSTNLPGDEYKRFAWSTCDPERVKHNFQTSVYFGDVALCFVDQPVRRTERFIASRRRKDAARPALPAGGVPFDLVGPKALPAPGYPVRSGVPFPKGAAKAGLSFGLLDPAGKSIPIVTTEISHWSDGSIRWLLCEFVATPKGRYRLMPRRKPAQPSTPVRVETNRGGTTITNGVLTLRLGGKSGVGVWKEISCAGAPDLGPLDFSVKMNRVGWRDHFTARRHHIRIEQANAVYATVLIEGDMIGGEEQRFGPWRARLHIWAGLPYVLVDWRLVNESDQAMAMLLDWSARLQLPDLAGAKVDFGAFESGHDPQDIGIKGVGHAGEVKTPRAIPLHADSELSCRQERADHARIYRNTSWVATADRAAGFVNLKHESGGIAAAMRWFAEEFPTGLVVRPDRLSLATLPESEDAIAWMHDRPFVRMGRGEAKRQSFALWPHDGTLPAAEAEKFNGCVQDAPRLFNQSWFIASHALETGPPRAARGLEGWANGIAPIIENTGIGAPRLGHREYWDTAWSNDYRGRSHQGLMQYIETGDPRWFRYFDAAITHNRDVDIIHYCPEHPDWVGANHSYGEDHTSSGPMGNIGSNCDGMLDHYLLTGDPDSLEAARGLAQRLLVCNDRGRCAREVGWPLAQITRWYDQTRDPRFAAKAEAFMQAARDYIEPRRGIFPETHGCWNYRGAVPFMSGYLAFGLIRRHQLLNDDDSLHLLELLAAGLFSEARTAPGRFYYSPFPENNFHVAGLIRSRAWNALVGGLAGYLYQVTGEPLYSEWAQECYDGIVEVSKDQQLGMDMLPIAGWMLHTVAQRASARARINTSHSVNAK